MPVEALDALTATAGKKARQLGGHPGGFFVSAMLAGAYVGVGVFVAFAVGAPMAAAASPWLKIVMGVSFGIALSLVVFAGAELFTGNALTMPVGCAARVVKIGHLLHVWATSWVGNLVGSALLAALLYFSGVLNTPKELVFVQEVAEKKMHLSIVALLARGALCNWLVCLGVWCAYRMKTETGKFLMICFCLYAFVSTGFEHSVANMTLLTLALLQPHVPAVSLGGMGYNLLWVTLGNLLGGALFVAGAYQYIARTRQEPPAA